MLPPLPGRTTGWGRSRACAAKSTLDDFHPFDFRLPHRSLFGRDLPAVNSAWSVAPAMDLVEKANAYEITAELPGIDEKNVEITAC